MCCSDKQAAVALATAGCTAAPEQRPDNNVHPVKPQLVRLVITGQRRNGGHFVAPVDLLPRRYVGTRVRVSIARPRALTKRPRHGALMSAGDVKLCDG